MLPKYEIVEHPNGFHEDHWCIQINDGEYEGLVYQYDRVKIGEQAAEGDEEVDLIFNTITVANPNNVDLTQENDKGILGAVLVDIIKDSLDREKNENGTPDTE
jgi:hypothetical protein